MIRRLGHHAGGQRAPLAIDLCCGLGGWTEGLLAEGYRVIGFDIEAHEYGGERYPGQLVLQDITTLHGSQFKNAALIVASPPCQEYSYMAMPWSRAKAKAAAIRADDTGAELERLNRLFNACFRIQREASAAAGRHIPMVVENVRGAQPWVGRAAWNFGSYYLWGDVPALMPQTIKGAVMRAGIAHRSNGATNFHGHSGGNDGSKNPGFRFDGSGRSFQSESVARHVEGVKVISDVGSRRTDIGKGARFTSRDCGAEAVKGVGIGSVSWGQGKGNRHPNDPRNFYSKSPARKAASAKIAKIPEALSRWIARTYRPQLAVAA